jgi:hypothetical protein
MNSGNWFPPGVRIVRFEFCGVSGFAWACDVCHEPMTISNGTAYFACTCHADNRAIPGGGERIDAK